MVDNLREKLVDLIIDAKRTDPETGRFTEYLADHLIANGVTFAEDINVPAKWIPVTERLPEENGIYLTFNKKRQYEFHMLQIGKRMWQGIWEEDGVTHWMPLPEAPPTAIS